MKAWIIVIILAVVIIGLVVWMNYKKNPKNNEAKEPTPTSGNGSDIPSAGNPVIAPTKEPNIQDGGAGSGASERTKFQTINNINTPVNSMG